MPQGEAVFTARDGHKDAVLGRKHLERLYRARDLLVHKGRKAAFAEGGIVSRKADNGFGLALAAIHNCSVNREW